MFESSLPVLRQEVRVIDGEEKLISSESEMAIKVDVSLYAQTRWETYFPALAEREDIFAYVERIQNSGSAVNVAKALSLLKAVYCLIDTQLTWQAFLQLFSVSDMEYFEKLVNRISSIISLAVNSSVEKN